MMKDNLIPAFRRGYRMQWEAAQNSHVVLYPEGMAKLNETATAILELSPANRMWPPSSPFSTAVSRKRVAWMMT